MTLYKILTSDGNVRFGTGKWTLPCGKERGDWMPRVSGKLAIKECVYHVCREKDLVAELGPTIFEAETRGDFTEYGDLIVAREARLVRRVSNWNSTSSRLFAADCAEHVLQIFENLHPNDDAPRLAIRAARLFARGKIDAENLLVYQIAAQSASEREANKEGGAESAAKSAAIAAAHVDVWDAAFWGASAAAGSAAYDAAETAAGPFTEDDPWGSAWEASWNTEREWQTVRLFEHFNGTA